MMGFVRLGLTRFVRRFLSIRLMAHLRTQFSPRLRTLVVHDLSADVSAALKLVLTARLSHEFRLQFNPGVTLPLLARVP